VSIITEWYGRLDLLSAWLFWLCMFLIAGAVIGAIYEALVEPLARPLPPPSPQTRRDWDQQSQVIRFRGKA